MNGKIALLIVVLYDLMIPVIFLKRSFLKEVMFAGAMTCSCCKVMCMYGFAYIASGPPLPCDQYAYQYAVCIFHTPGLLLVYYGFNNNVLIVKT